MHRWIINKNIDYVRKYITDGIVIKDKPSFALHPMANDNKLKGKICGEDIWIQKTKQRFYRGCSRIFYGKIIEMGNDKTLIKGEFKLRPFDKFSKIIFCFCLLIIFSYNLFAGNLDLLRYTTLIYTTFFSVWILERIGIFLYREDEEDIIRFFDNILFKESSDDNSAI